MRTIGAAEMGVGINAISTMSARCLPVLDSRHIAALRRARKTGRDLVKKEAAKQRQPLESEEEGTRLFNWTDRPRSLI